MRQEDIDAARLAFTQWAHTLIEMKSGFDVVGVVGDASDLAAELRARTPARVVELPVVPADGEFDVLVLVNYLTRQRDAGAALASARHVARHVWVVDVARGKRGVGSDELAPDEWWRVQVTPLALARVPWVVELAGPDLMTAESWSPVVSAGVPDALHVAAWVKGLLDDAGPAVPATEEMTEDDEG